MSSDSIDQVFEKAISTIHTLSSLKGFNSLPRPPAHIRIELYALYKQSTEGDVESVLTQPAGDPHSPDYNVALRKWDAWKTKEGLSKTEAKKEYIQLLITTMKSYAMGTIAARELLADLEFLWWQVTNDPTEIVDESSSMMMAIQDELQDAKSLRLRKEIYETLSSLNEIKPRALQNGVPEHRKADKSGSARQDTIKALLAIAVSIIKWALLFVKRVVLSSIVMLGVLAAAKNYGHVSTLSLDFHTRSSVDEKPKGATSMLTRFLGPLWFSIRIINKYGGLKIKRITMNIE
ncbi:LAFE_0F15148g1_1 [Lachancea fermentati]|uniref:LAFE_0F15148g1_1 n=1 Tax=Lachancea fermentati TaxID=4955 RepID=A0A1G4MGH0_LACFM|nr:LAFE_0F15148g1_1 [Lachancea fermentati]